MALNVEDVEELARLLESREDLRRKLLRILLSQELLELPVAFQRFRDQTFEPFRVQTESRLQAIETSLQTLTENVLRLTELFLAHRAEFLAYREETERRFGELAEAVRALIERTDRHDRRLEDHARDLGEVKGMQPEARCRAEAGALFRHLLRRATPASGERKLQILEEAEAAGRITGEEADRAANLDLLVTGFHRREDRPLYLAVEISWLGGRRMCAGPPSGRGSSPAPWRPRSSRWWWRGISPPPRDSRPERRACGGSKKRKPSRLPSGSDSPGALLGKLPALPRARSVGHPTGGPVILRGRGTA